MSCLTPLLRSPSRSSLLPAELAQIHLNISQNLLREAQLLAQVDAIEAECQQAELEHRSILEELSSANETLIKLDSPISTISTIQVTSPLIPPLPSPMAPPPSSSRHPVMIPVGQPKDLTPQASSLLKHLWAKIGYEGSAFSGMQVEISKELSRADFARYERQMLCNEILRLRHENQTVRYERDELHKRAIINQSNLSKVIEAEDRTYKTLMTERENTTNAIESARRGVEKLALAKEKEAQKSKALSYELDRLEQERISAVRYAKNAEEQAAMANLTAKAATAVAVSAVSSHPNTPRLSSYNNQNLTNSSRVSPSLSHARSPSLTSRSPYPSHSTLPSSSSYINNSRVQPAWSLDDEMKLMEKIKEKNRISNEKMYSEDKRSLNDMVYARLERETLGTNLPSVSRNPSPSSYSNKQYHQDHPQTPKRVDWNTPLIGSSSTTAKRY